jgi:hypothetical protein
MSSTTNSYFVNVDSYYRDNAKYPNPTDFGINFASFEGTGTFVQGDPLNANSFFQQASIDPDYLDNELSFLNATITNSFRTSEHLYVAGVFDYTKDFIISYDNTNTLFIQTGTNLTGGSNVFGISKVYMFVPFLSKLSYTPSTVSNPYALDWIFYLRPSNSYNFNNKSTKCTFQLTAKEDIYCLFDFSMRNFDFVIYKNGIANLIGQATNPSVPTNLPADSLFAFELGTISNCLVYIDKSGNVGTVNGHSYGYHIFTSNFNLFQTQTNGSFSLETDNGDNAYVSLNVNNFINRTIKTDNIGITFFDGIPLPPAANNEATGYVFNNSTGPVYYGMTNISFAETVTSSNTGPIKVYFTLDDPAKPYLETKFSLPFGTRNGFLYNFWGFQGPDLVPPATKQFFMCSTNDGFTSTSGITGGTGTYIFEIDKSTYNMTLQAVIPTTGSSNMGQCSTGGITYIFNKNPYNYLEVFTFDTITYALTKIGDIQTPSLWPFFSYPTFDVRGSQIWNYWLDGGIGFVPQTYYSQNQTAIWILCFDTSINSFTYLNYIVIPMSIGYGFRVDARLDGKKYLIFSSVTAQQLLYYDVTNPYLVTKAGSCFISASLRTFNLITRIVGSAVKYYLSIQYAGGDRVNNLFDVTDPSNIIPVGAIGELQSLVLPYENQEFTPPYRNGQEVYVDAFGATQFYPGLTGAICDHQCIVQSQLKNVTVESIHYNQNLQATFATPVGATRAQCFNQNDVQYLVYASFAQLSIYDISSIRGVQFITALPLGLPATTMYDFKTISYNGSQYFFIAALGYIFGFILLPNFAGIVPVGLYSAAQAFAELQVYTYNNQLFFLATTYGSCRIYKFSVSPAITFQQFVTMVPGLIPNISPTIVFAQNNRIYTRATVTNFTSNADINYYWELTNFGITLATVFIAYPGPFPRSSSKYTDPRDQQTYISGFVNVAIGAFDINFNDVTGVPIGNLLFANFQTINFSVGLNAFTNFFYTDRPYLISNKYGGPGTKGDYLSCFDLTYLSYDVQVMDLSIAAAGTGPYPAYVIDMNISQLGSKVTCVNVLSNGFTYLYDMSNPSYAGKYQTLTPITSVATNPSFSLGSSFISKLDPEGNQLWISRLSNYQTGSNRASELINNSNMKISKDNLTLYVCGGWTNQIQAFPPNSTGPNCRITSYDSKYNGFVASLNTIDGVWNWILPIQGANNDYVQRLEYASNLNTIGLVGYTTSDNLIIYQRQLAGNLNNPTIPQLNIVGSTNNTNSFVLYFNSAGTLNWHANIYSNVSTTTVNMLDIGYDNGVFVVSGLTNSSLVECTDSTLANVQDLYTKCQSTNQYAIINYYFNTSGVYLRSQYIQLPFIAIGNITDSKIYSSQNLTTFCPTFSLALDSVLEFYNKDGTLAELHTGPSNSLVSYVVDYKNESRYFDQNVYYSNIRLANPPPPYAFTGGEYINYSLYVLGVPDDKVLNKSFSVRNNEVAGTGDYRIILNNSIDTAKIVRLFPEVNSITGSNEFYSVNLSSSPLLSIITYNIASQPTINNTITILSGLSANSLSSSTTYYVTFPKGGDIVSLQVLSFTVDVNGNYVFTLQDVNDLRVSPLGPFYGPYLYLTQFNQNIFYTLQFFPSNITTPVFFFVQLDSLVIPNRPLRQSANADERFLTDMPYIYLALYTVNDQDIDDKDIVNIVFDNNPNRERIAIFQLNTVNAGDTTNFVTYNTTVRPKIKFVPNFNTLRIKLIDRYGNIILFDNTPYKPSDARFTGGVVSPKLMNMTIRFFLQKI